MPNKSNEQKCPICGNQVSDDAEKKALLPFCSKRCKMIDLGQWLTEKYVVDENKEPAPKKNRTNSDE